MENIFRSIFHVYAFHAVQLARFIRYEAFFIVRNKTAY